ncbi:MAG: hypothetical protein ACPG49_04920 [Chitinophagales bacterium]
MNKEMTVFQQVLIIISLLTIAPPIFYFGAILGGTYYDLPVLSLFMSMSLIALFMVSISYLALKIPLLLIGIDGLCAYGIYYFVNIWNPYPAYDVLVYQDDLQLFGKVKNYQEEHYVLSGSLDNPQKGGKLQHAIAVFFNENGNKTKDETTYRSSPFKRPSVKVNEYFYNIEGQRIRKNDNISYRYDEEGRLWKVLEETSSVFKTIRTDYQTETTYYYNDTSHSSVEDEKRRSITHYHTPDTSYYSKIRKTIFNENGQVLYEGKLKEGDLEGGSFLYDVKYTYNESNQLVYKNDISYNEKITTYEYDDAGFLEKEKTESFREDKTKLYAQKVIEYDNWGNEVYESNIEYYTQNDQPYAPESERQLFIENEYDSLQNLIQKTIFIQENDEPKRPYYLVEIDLTYY